MVFWQKEAKNIHWTLAFLFKVQHNSDCNFVFRISGFHIPLGYKKVLDVYLNNINC